MLRTTPVGEDTVTSARTRGASAAEDDLYGRAERQGTAGARDEDDDGWDDEDDDQPEKPSDEHFLQMVREAESQAQLYVNQVNKKSWTRVYRAFHQEHFVGSKYTTDDFKNRSKLFIPKTRVAVRKDMAAVAASLFGTMDAVSTTPGNESDKMQKASADVIKEVLNYRTDRTSGKAALPWFRIAIGARQTSVLTGVCLSKQSWKLELRQTHTENSTDEETGERVKRAVWKPYIDRPDSQLIPPENFVIDPAADWTNPAQDAGYIIIKWPMRIHEIRSKQKDPRNPWKPLTESQLRGSSEKTKFDMAAIRRAREQGLDRMDDVNNPRNFDVIWVYETYMRTEGEDWTFLSVGDKCMLTDPRPVSEVYPEQYGERPLTFGIGSFEAFRLFPMSSAESWQMLQMEANDIRNLSLDAIKQNISPVSKVVRGRQVDLDSLKRRGQGTSIMVTDKDDVSWDRPPDLPASVQMMKQSIDIEFDDIAGQQNYGTVDANNNLSKTLGGLKLAAGAANAVQEFDIRIWIETWCEPTLMQIVRLIQFYESDPIILGLCGDRAKLLEKHGIDEITDELLENEVLVRVNVGLGTGDPSQRLAKFSDATNVAMPLLEKSPDFMNGTYTMDVEAIMDEVYGAVGYRDGGKRFVKKGDPKTNPMQQPQMDALAAKTDKDKKTGLAALITALSNAAKVGLGQREIEDAFVNSQFNNSLAHMDQMGKARDFGHKHGEATHRLANPGSDGIMGTADDIPAEGGADQGVAPPPAAGGGGPAPQPGAAGLAETADNIGAGNSGIAPGDLGKHGVPAGDAGQQQAADRAASEQALQKATKPKKVTIKARDKDGRASEFHIE